MDGLAALDNACFVTTEPDCVQDKSQEGWHRLSYDKVASGGQVKWLGVDDGMPWAQVSTPPPASAGSYMGMMNVNFYTGGGGSYLGAAMGGSYKNGGICHPLLLSMETPVGTVRENTGQRLIFCRE